MSSSSSSIEFTFTPKHGSWLNLVQGFFSKMARSVLRYIRVASKKRTQGSHHGNRLLPNQNSVVHTWTYKLDKAA
jgi:hypothetical protein